MKKREGFTLVELLVVMGILAILAAILLTCLGRIRERARYAVCMNNLHQVWLAYQMAAMDASEDLADLDPTAVYPYLNERYWKCPSDPFPLYWDNGSPAISYGQLVYRGSSDLKVDDGYLSPDSPFLLDATHHNFEQGPWIVCTASGRVYLDNNPCQPMPTTSPYFPYHCMD